ncbi:addiction module toxin RelE [Candidatus Woesearchaeota archaeon]|nr:addiction module toxin RelE [Candidatus Woesearchaeota archaeon]
MYRLQRSEKLVRILKKLYKRDKRRYEATISKIEEVMKSAEPGRYKHLSYELKDFKRVHIDSHFILTFKIYENSKTISFMDLQHHDTAYRR